MSCYKLTTWGSLSPTTNKIPQSGWSSDMRSTCPSHRSLCIYSWLLTDVFLSLRTPLTSALPNIYSHQILSTPRILVLSALLWNVPYSLKMIQLRFWIVSDHRIWDVGHLYCLTVLSMKRILWDDINPQGIMPTLHTLIDVLGEQWHYSLYLS